MRLWLASAREKAFPLGLITFVAPKYFMVKKVNYYRIDFIDDPSRFGRVQMLAHKHFYVWNGGFGVQLLHVIEQNEAVLMGGSEGGFEETSARNPTARANRFFRHVTSRTKM